MSADNSVQDEIEANKGIPNLGTASPFKLDASNDPFFFNHDLDSTIVISDTDSSEELIPFTLPLYQNQEEDPEIRALIYKEMMESD